jgi:ketosteroid isomerase-like protein
VSALAVLETFSRHLRAGDAVAAANLFTEDAVYEELPAFRFEGRPAIGAFFKDFAERHVDAELRVSRCVEDGTRGIAAAEWHWSYRSAGTHASTVFEGMSFLVLRDGKIAHWRGVSARVA